MTVRLGLGAGLGNYGWWFGSSQDHSAILIQNDVVVPCGKMDPLTGADGPVL